MFSVMTEIKLVGKNALVSSMNSWHKIIILYMCLSVEFQKIYNQHIHGYCKNEFNMKNPNHEHDKAH